MGWIVCNSDTDMDRVMLGPEVMKLDVEMSANLTVTLFGGSGFCGGWDIGFEVKFCSGIED